MEPSSTATGPFDAYEGQGPYVFVSYARRDLSLVYPELETLKELGLNVWYDQGISPGSRWSDELANRIRDCDLFLFLVTPNSAASVHCQDEATFALDHGKSILAIHLVETELPPGLQLRMGARQAILKYQMDESQYCRKLAAASGVGITSLPSEGEDRLAPATTATRRRGAGGDSKGIKLAVMGAAVAVLALGAFWFGRQGSEAPAPTQDVSPATGIEWARNVAAPEIERLLATRDVVGAFVLARQALEILPDDRDLKALAAETVVPVEVTSRPMGAKVSVKAYDDPEGDWLELGRTPISNIPATDLRWRFEKDSYTTRELALSWNSLVEVQLFSDGQHPPGMVHVPGGPARIFDESGHLGPSASLEGFWIDQYEVTNAAYRAFLNSPAYRSAEHWAPILAEIGVLQDPLTVVAGFVDSTGQPGPATWSLRSYPDGEDQYPVQGVSWAEAAAYCAFAGKQLPTVFHFAKTGQQEGLMTSFFASELMLSNFDLKGPRAVGATAALGAYGTYDLLGNVKEWAWNTDGVGRRNLSGAGFDDPAYMSLATGDQLAPLTRAPNTGLRCVQDPEGQNTDILRAPVTLEGRAAVSLEGASDELFKKLAEQYAFEPTPLNAELGETVSSSPYWRRQVVTIDTAYGERMDLLVYLPNEAAPPYQTVVYFPGSNAHMHEGVGGAGESSWLYFIPRSGRALVIPMYSGLYSRRAPYPSLQSREKIELVIRWAQDLKRAIDYLETRKDIASDKLAYYGFSLGGTYGPVFTALEQRFKASVYVSGGTTFRVPDEHWPPYFAPRVKVPTLMIAGRYDSQSPVDTYQQPLLELLGTPPEDRQLWIFEGGHAPTDWNATVRAMLDWFDRYLGKPSRN